MYACYHCGRGIRGQVKHTQPCYAGDFPKAYHPQCYERAEEAAAEELYGLERQPHRGWKRGGFANAKTTQRALLTGLNCLPGQGDLFQTDGEPES